MYPFEGFEEYDENGDIMICVIQKGMYGLVQAALLWNQALVSFFVEHEFHQCLTDPCLFVSTQCSEDEYLVVPVHVDDMIPTGKPKKIVHDFLDKLESKFKIKRLGPIEWFSGIMIKRDENHVYFTQPYYSDNLLKQWDMTTAKPSKVPMNHGEDMFKLTHDNPNDPSHDQTEVLSLGSSLGWLVECTRPDLMFTRMNMARMSQRCTDSSFKLMKNALRYLAATKWQGLRYSKGTEFPNTLITFVDASLSTCAITGRAAYCVIIFLNGGPIYWRCKLLPGKPPVATLEAEYAACHIAANDTVYFRMVMYELGFTQNQATIIYCDNAAAIQLREESRVTWDNKHINLKYHSLRWAKEQHVLTFEKVDTAENPADIGTKIIKDDKCFQKHVSTLLHDCSIFRRPEDP